MQELTSRRYATEGNIFIFEHVKSVNLTICNRRKRSDLYSSRFKNSLKTLLRGFRENCLNTESRFCFRICSDPYSSDQTFTTATPPLKQFMYYWVF